MLNRPKKWNISIIFVNILGDPVGRILKLKTIWTPDIGNIEPDIHPAGYPGQCPYLILFVLQGLVMVWGTLFNWVYYLFTNPALVRKNYVKVSSNQFLFIYFQFSLLHMLL